MSALVIYLTHHNNVQLRMFRGQFSRKFNNDGYPNLHFMTALYEDGKVTRQDDDIEINELCGERLSPQSIAEFFDGISKVKQQKHYENIILCLEANLGDVGGRTTNATVRECIQRAGASNVTLFSATPECLEAAKMEYPNSCSMLFQPHGFSTIVSHLELIQNSNSTLISASQSSNPEFTHVDTPNNDSAYDQYVYFGSNDQLPQLNANDHHVADGVKETSTSLLTAALHVNDDAEYGQFLITDLEDEPDRSKKIVHHNIPTDESLNHSTALNRAPGVNSCCCFFSSAKVYSDSSQSTPSVSLYSSSSVN